MAMLPIFLVGVVIGIALSGAWYMYRKDTPSQIKLETQEFIINSQKNDIKLLIELNEKLYDKINKLEKELKK